jgi:catechol 2,3-dioxygenase-like lactoylglutathione lyase family enzyme
MVAISDQRLEIAFVPLGLHLALPPSQGYATRAGAGWRIVQHMLTRFDHVTIAVTDIAGAVEFFSLLGFELDKDVVISGQTMDRYMGIENIEARHVTLFLKGAEPRLEVQLLHFHRPTVIPAPDVSRLDRIGFNHICFAVEDIGDVVARVTAAGIRLRNEVMMFHDRKLVFLEGPEGITVELAQWL